MDAPVQRGMTLEQAHIERLGREMAEMRNQMQQILEGMRNVNIRHPRRVVENSSSGESDHSNNRSFDGSDDDHGRRRRNRPRNRIDNIKVEVPEFQGNLNPDDFIDWLQSIEKVFDYNEYDDEKKFKVAVLKFKGYANLWWENTKTQRVREGRSRIRSWEKLKQLMKRRFLPDNYKQELYLRLTHLKQSNLSVGDYTREFELLQMRCDLHEPEEQTIARYLHGLNRDVAAMVELQQYWTFDDVRKLATKVEKQLSHGKRSNTKFQAQGTTSIPTKAESSQAKRVEVKKHVKNSNLETAKKCFKCHGYGHFQAECPNPRVMTIREIREIEEELEKEHQETKEDEQNTEHEDECNAPPRPDPTGAVVIDQQKITTHNMPS